MKTTYNELVEALKETHKLYIVALKNNNFATHDITRLMGNEWILSKLDKSK